MKQPTAKQTHIQDILCPVNGYRGELARKGIVPKDHRRDNLKEIQKCHAHFVEKQAAAIETKKESQFSLSAS